MTLVSKVKAMCGESILQTYWKVDKGIASVVRKGDIVNILSANLPEERPEKIEQALDQIVSSPLLDRKYSNLFSYQLGMIGTAEGLLCKLENAGMEVRI